MFSLKPLQLSTTFICPDCKCKFGQPDGGLFFQGTSVLANCLCECCENRYYHTLPTGHAALFPVAFSLATFKARYSEANAKWFAEPLINSLKEISLSFQGSEESITKTILKKQKEIILLNCLDSCYGHVFLKLLNAQTYLREYPEKGLVLLIPAGFSWLLPSGISEVWEVDIRLRELDKGVPGLDKFIKKELERFESVLLSEVPVHPDIHRFDLKEFLKTEKFDLDQFEKLPARITFVLREDRFWLNSRLDSFLQRLSISRGWGRFFKGYFVGRQNRLIRSLAKRVQKQYGAAILFHAVGLGTSGSLGSLVKDHRKDKAELSEEIEKEWCRLYAESHLVLGIHGSNMLIPTALSAGFIELLPRHKIYNLSEDIAMDRKGRYMHFLGRFLDEFSSVHLVTEHAVSMLKWFPVVKKNMEE